MDRQVAIRVLGPGDDMADAVTLLVRASMEEGLTTVPAVIARNLKTMLELDICAVLMAEAQGEGVGIATVALDFGIEHGWRAGLGSLYVLPEWRKDGLASGLVGEACAWAHARGCTGLDVAVTEAAEKRRGLADWYRSLGFRDQGRRVLYLPL